MSKLNWNLPTGKEKCPRLVEHSSGYVVSEVTSPIPIGRGKKFNLTIPKLNRLSGNNKFWQINDFNASGSNPVVQPVAPTPTIVPSVIPPVTWLSNIIPTPIEEPTLDGTKDEAAAQPSSSEAVEPTEHYIPYGIALLIGAGIGYEVAKKYNKDIYGGMLIGGGIVAGCAWLYFNKSSSPAPQSPPAPSTSPSPTAQPTQQVGEKSNASGGSSPSADCSSFDIPIKSGTRKCKCVNGKIEWQSNDLVWRPSSIKCP